MAETIKGINAQPWEQLQARMAREARKTKKWQHEDTGRLVDMPIGKIDMNKATTTQRAPHVCIYGKK